MSVHYVDADDDDDESKYWKMASSFGSFERDPCSINPLAGDANLMAPPSQLGPASSAVFSVQCARVGKSVYYSDRPVMDSCCRASPTFDQFPALNVSPANFGLIFYQQP